MYVRRELRELAPADLEAFLAAFGVLVGTPTMKGRKLYGAHYKSLDDYVRMHLKGAGARSHDKIHDGMGVLTQHAAMTADFERSLQAVDASVAVPFWDYTRDAALAKVAVPAATNMARFHARRAAPRGICSPIKLLEFIIRKNVQ